MTFFTEPQMREIRQRLRLQSAAQRVAGAFSPAAHTHAESDITGLETDLANRAVLDDANVFAGPQDTFEHVHANEQLSTDGSVVIEEGEIKATLLTSARVYELPDAGGTLLVDAPSDGKYYARKDGAWVEIVP